jgi:hypothetical protein
LGREVDWRVMTHDSLRALSVTNQALRGLSVTL